MANNYKYVNGDVEFSNIKNAHITTSQKISSSKYNVDEEGNIIKPNKIINAIDIDWNNAKIKGIDKTISNTADLLELIADSRNIVQPQTVSSNVTIGENGHWFIDDVDTGISAIGENGLTPYIKDGAWYIGNIKIIDIIEGNNGLTPYIKDGHWWIGDTDTGVIAEGTAGNSPYIGDDGYWYINGHRLDGIPGNNGENGVAGSDGNTPYIKDGHWWIGDIDTGVVATASNGQHGTSSIITIGENGNWFINGEDTGSSASKTVYITGGDGNSIPLYDAETEERLRNENALPNKYISLGDEYNLPNNISLIASLFATVQALQQEVNKLKNTFTRGIYSYNGEATYMSNVVGQYGDDEEPLWAIDESELSEIEDLDFNYSESSYYEDNGVLKAIENNRMFLFTTIDKLNKDENKNFIITFNDTSDESSNNINLADYITSNNKCNVMIMISRKPSDKNYPNNYIYITITDYVENQTIKLGYLSKDLTIEHDEQSLLKNYYFKKIDYTNNTLYKFDIYSQDRTFGSEVLGSVPDEEDDSSYRVAHIAVRSVKNYGVITKIAKQLVNNEFIIDEEEEKLYLKINNKIINIGAPSGEQGHQGGNTDDPDNPDNPWPGDDDDIMTKQEIIKALEEQGVITVKYVDSSLTDDEHKYDPVNIISYKFNNIGSIRFTHEDTGKTYEYKTNAYGELESKLIQDSTSFAEILRGLQIKDDFKSVRGLIGQIGEKQANLRASADHGLNADRIRIGAIYAPTVADVTFGCSHAYVELENTSNKDFNLVGCQLHFIKPEYSSILERTIYTKRSIELTGILPAGSTYLIRGKKYIENDNDSNCYIHVNTYDQEWYDNGELIDFTMNTSYPSYAFILSYHGKVNVGDSEIDFLNESNILYNLGKELSLDTITTTNIMTYLGDEKTRLGSLLVSKDNPGSPPADDAAKNSPLVYAKGFIDAIVFGTSTRYGIFSAYTYTANCLYKGTYELDPAKQAFNGFTRRDSSRHRWEKKGNDYQYIKLSKEAIEFPKTPTKRLVEYFTPKASFEHKNIISDKTKFDHEKPNAVSVSYGENVYTTRCFNWVSSSNLDEYVWIYDSYGNFLKKFESYKKRDLTEKVTTSEEDINIISELSDFSSAAKYSYIEGAWKFTDSTSVNIYLSDDDNDTSVWVVKYVSNENEEIQGWYKYKKIKSNVIASILSYPSDATYTYNESNDTWTFTYTDIDGDIMSTVITKDDFTKKVNDETVYIYDSLADLKFEYTSKVWKTYLIDAYEKITGDDILNVPNNATTSITKNKCTFTYVSNTYDYVSDDQTLKFKFDTTDKWYSYHEVSTKTYTDTLYDTYITTRDDTTKYPLRKEFQYDVCNIAYCDYRVNEVIDRDNGNKDVTYGKYAKSNRCCGLFAGSNEFFTSHKCIIDIVKSPVQSKTTYSYIVGQADKNGNPIPEHSSERRYFTLYPESYKPVIYQITDQQGFHWIEYQVWAAAAIELNKKINADITAADNAGESIMPIIINTGDMTQSGSRVNEWLDYYIAGDSLFNHLEQVNIVGNNDLNGTDIQALGTGDDPGKSNPYYYYVFNCNEINNFFTDDNSVKHYPIVNKTYIPSLYYIDCKDLRIVLVNSEITPINCRDWYNLRCTPYADNNKEYTINIYTGYSMRGDDSTIIEKYVADNLGDMTFTPIYTLLWYAINKAKNGNKPCITACHEMPYTVVTQACCSEKDQITRFRSISDAAAPGKLIGSHLNQMQPTEDGAGVYWFSRLLESLDVNLCIGGHKHTYAITYPVRENYKYYVGDILKSSKNDGPMSMPETLKSEERTSQNDYKVIWSWKPDVSGSDPKAEYQWYKNDKNNAANNYGDGDTEVINWSKLPLAYRGQDIINTMPANTTFYPVTALYANDGFANKAVTYIMCQATGYKLTSNKELPTPNQKFSRIIPRTSNGSDGTDTPNNNQKFPMYIKYDITNNNGSLECRVFLTRITNIFNAKYKFDMSTYATAAAKLHYLIDKHKYTELNQNNLSEDVECVAEYDSNNTSSEDQVIRDIAIYDNYGLWVNKEKQMIDTIIL